METPVVRSPDPAESVVAMVRTRFAPSPTGYLHIGGVRTALFNWLYARRHGGQFLLRIDDTDQQRNLAEALQPILDGFRWLGIDWDEGPEVGGPHAPYFQSQRTARHQAAVQQLLTAGAAYYDYARPEELQEERTAAEREKKSFVYSRRFMAESEAERAAFEREGRSAVVRLKMPRSGVLELQDLIRGDVQFAWEREQDHVVQRADGSCLYHLATVVDDYDFEITHVIRAEEHLSNTPRQIFIAQALGYPLPQFAHIPFVAEPGSHTKLSKRKLAAYRKNRDFANLCDQGEAIAAKIHRPFTAEDFNPVLVEFYREIGFLPDAVVNYLLLLGWALDDRTEFFSREQMIEAFSLDRINKAPASFDPQKLMAFQSHYMQELPTKQKVAKVLPYLQKAGWVETPAPCSISDYLTMIVQGAGERLVIAGDILKFPEFFVTDDQLEFVRSDLEKHLLKADGARDWLLAYRNELAQCSSFKAADLETHLKDFVHRKSIKLGQIIQALRVAVTGKAVGFGMFETLEILGEAKCLRRIDRALQLAESHS